MGNGLKYFFEADGVIICKNIAMSCQDEQQVVIRSFTEPGSVA